MGSERFQRLTGSMRSGGGLEVGAQSEVLLELWALVSWFLSLAMTDLVRVGPSATKQEAFKILSPKGSEEQVPPEFPTISLARTICLQMKFLRSQALSGAG